MSNIQYKKQISTILILCFVTFFISGCRWLDDDNNTPDVDDPVDATAPVITLTGANPQTIEIGDAYTELGATATDNADGNITGSITIDASSVDTATVGSYSVTYNVSDVAGNAAATQTRTVDVVPDATPPVITLTGANPQTIEAGTAYAELNATAADNIDGDISANIVIDATAVDTTTVGSYSVTYNVSDATGNAAATETRTVDIVDTTAPVITLNGDSTMTVDLDATYAEPGATVTDNVDTGLNVTITGTVDTSTVGDYQLSYDVTDAAGNIAVTVIRTVSVISLTDTLTGYFSDSEVAGLTYTTDTLSGITDALGTFYYLSGETITFSLGGTIIGDSVTAKDSMTPFDLVPGAGLYTTATQIKDVLYNDLRENERKAFNKFSNVLSFLQTLDDDANPANGINIKSGMATLFAAVQIDFEQDLFRFYQDKKLRIITHQAAAQGLLSTAGIKKEGFALDHFYSEQNISHNITVESTKSYDSDADGSPNSVRTYTYDAIGNQLSESNDTDGDGNLNRMYSITYDANGNRLTYSSDDNGDGNLDRIATYTYDSNGNQLTFSNDTDLDGNPNSTAAYTYDPNGNNLTYSSDTNADGSPNRVRSYTYDSNGNRLTHIYDSDGDGNPNKSDTYTYDANDNLLTESSDRNGDGSLNESYTYTYDANDNLLTESYDSDGDGNPNNINTYTYDANGNKLTHIYDSDGDGNPNNINTYTYDTNGNLLTDSYDSDLDGNPERIETYTYDANNNRLVYNDDTNGDGSPNRVRTYTYDANGNRLTESYDSYSDANPIRVDTYTYDANGNRLTRSTDTDDDGNPNKVDTYTFDANDNRLTHLYDEDGNGSPDVIQIYTYVSSTWVAILDFFN